MPNRNFSELYDLILPYVPAVETPLVDYHIRRMTREFCRRTTLWRKRVTITTQPGVNDYLLAPYDATEVSAGPGGGGETWVPAHQSGVTVSLLPLAVTTDGLEVIGYNPATSVWSMATSPEFQQSNNAIISALRIGVIGVGARVRLTPLPRYFQGEMDTWKEFSYATNGSYFPITVRSKFTAFSGPSGAQVDFTNTATANGQGIIENWTPTPIVITNGANATPVAVDEVTFAQGSANETASTVAFNMLVEILPAAPAADPEICDPYSIISVACEGRRIDPLPEDYRQPYGARPANDKPQAWYSPSARVVHLYPTPDAVYTVVVDVVCALTMTPTLPELPEFLFVDYREIIADGVIASLKVLANKPWYDPEGATLYSRRYAFAVQGIRAKLRDGNQPNASTARGPRFGR